MDVELAEVRDFLAAHPPYDALPAEVLADLPRRLTARYFRRGSVIVPLGGENDQVHVLRSGAVDLFDGNGDLVDRSDPGTSFGLSSVLARGPSLYRIVAHEDSLCLLLPAEHFHRLMAQHPGFSEFFLRQQVGRLEAALRGAASSATSGAGSPVMRTPVREIVAREPVTVDPGTTVAEAARLMDASGGISALMVTDATGLVGIVTDRDIRSKVVAAGGDPTGPVAGIMTAGPVTVPAEALAFEALVEMTHHRVHHLPIVDDGAVVGMVTAGDLIRLESSNPVHLVGEVARQTSVEGLREATARAPEAVSAAVAGGATAEEVERVLTALADSVTRRLLEQAEAELGPPPVRYCWVALGSQGRMETGLQSDQDNALIIDDALDDARGEDLDGHLGEDRAAYFAELAERVVAGLEACGYPRCPGDMMATNPRWCVPLRTWRRYVDSWLTSQQPESVLRAQTFFDMRPVHGDRALCDAIQDAVRTGAPGQQRFLLYLAGSAQRFRPPLGFFRDFVLEHSGEHRKTLDIKAGGIAPIVQIARLASLASGQGQHGTRQRLRAAAAAGGISEQSAADLSAAFDFLSLIRVRHQVEQLGRGEQPDNHVPPAMLAPFERRHLKEAFAVVRSAQGELSVRYRTDLVT
ncbi:cyclic nucleotide-binding/CBS domain-containing protein [Nocardioides sp. GY 10113]|uniref:DUF294 nucleotidyltransferase-like domain-containing protein n=1 Tax=Nocardioides sp. GY 10113 TaxID=2569761 RepID=UPI0010A8AC99|nr:DUF294 nucleotidyltransferase-like domain-containing protein [Nocardioides sp. GY 10113]TIC87450.1 cyclic nucleotide-binding/CBS domain-containing protein [Nocardioides sp. GY 10113]